MPVRLYQQTFNGGELSPEMYGRAADPKYQSGLAKCSNFLIDPRGPVVARPGFAKVNTTKYAGKKSRLIPFTFSVTQSMVLELGDKYIRFHTDGQTLVKADGTPYEVETPYSEEDVFDIHYVQQADIVTLVHPSHAPRELRRYGALDWRLQQVSFTSSLQPPAAPTVVQTINSEVTNKTDYVRKYALTALKADGSEESSIGAATSIQCNPFGAGAYNTISWAAVAGAELYRVYRNQGGIWAYIGQTSSLSIIDENISPDASITPPNYDDPFYQAKGITSVTVTNAGSGYSSVSGGIGGIFGLSLSSQVVGTGSDSYDSAPTPPAITVTATVYDAEGAGSGGQVSVQKTESISNYYSATGGNAGEKHAYHKKRTVTVTGITVTAVGSFYKKPKVTITINAAPVVTQTFDLPTITKMPTVSVTDSTGSGAELSAVVAEGKIAGITIVRAGSGYSAPQVVITAPEGSGATATATTGRGGDYPGAVTYFEQRRWFGGTVQRPNNLWATRSGTESDMSYSLPTQDSDRIAVRVAAREANRILHFVPLAHLILLTGSAEWRISPLNNDAITPASMSVRPQSYVGSNNVQPVVVNNSALYVAGRGGHLRECGYSYEAGGFITNDVCVRANHLFDNLDVTDLAFGKAPFPIVWAVSSNGKLISFTYIPEQQVGGFSSIETKGEFESCAVVAEAEEDILYCVVKRTINGEVKRFVERMHEIRYTTLEDTMHLDCSGSYKGTPKTEITGLSWLEGETVGILADGGVEPPQQVKNGKIVLEKEASVVHVGLLYNAELQTLPLASANIPDGSYGSAHKKNVKGVELRVVNSSGFSAGPSFDRLVEYPARSTELAGTPPSPSTGVLGVEIHPKWNNSGQVCIRQANPLPLKVISLTTTVEIV